MKELASVREMPGDWQNVMEKSGNISGHLVQGKLSRGLLHVWATADKHVSQFEKDYSAYYVSLDILQWRL